MRTTISRTGRIALSAQLQRLDNIESGDIFEIKRIGRGKYLLRRRTGPRNEGLIGLLLACPAKDWFRPLDRTELTGSVPVPAIESRRV